MQNTCVEIKLRAERRAGARLAEQGRGQWGRPENSDTMSPLEEADVVEDSLGYWYIAGGKIQGSQRVKLTGHVCKVSCLARNAAFRVIMSSHSGMKCELNGNFCNWDK